MDFKPNVELNISAHPEREAVKGHITNPYCHSLRMNRVSSLTKGKNPVFDIGFSELVVCAIVALIVIGPERMPEAVRTVGLWVGRFKRSLRETRSEIERQMGVDDIRRQLHNEEIMRSLEDARRDIDSALSQTQQAIDSTAEVVTREYKSEPDLPYHSHMEEQAANTVAELPQPDIASENVITPDNNSSAPVEQPADKKVSL